MVQSVKQHPQNMDTFPRLVSTDVFDTLLLRTGRSERSRIAEAERRFSIFLRNYGIEVSPAHLVRTRLLTQRLAFRALNTSGHRGEVRLADILERQFYLLGIDASHIAERRRIELDVEKESLFPNIDFAERLRSKRAVGHRIVAISDTTLCGSDVQHLIEHFHGKDLIDAVYASADHDLTKRQGDLFTAVSEAESVPFAQMHHFGDDAHADMKVPERRGIRAEWMRRPRHRGVARQLDGAWTTLRQSVRLPSQVNRFASRPPDPESFGHEVFGPIVTQFAIHIWLYAAEAARSGKPVLLFCSRGGIGIREAFERVLSRLNLPLEMPRHNLMVSRLVAARAAVLNRSPSAVKEIGRDFYGQPMSLVAEAMGGNRYQLSDEWQKPFDGQVFLQLLYSDGGLAVLGDMEAQNILFRQHLTDLTKGADRIILCDTGLYGSTQKLLADGFPELHFETIQFARSNYKRHDETHFSRVVGLIVEQDRYSPWNPASTVLRYWHIIESLFEPDVKSVRMFHEASDGTVEGNCGPIAFGALDQSVFSPMLIGALRYIESITRNRGARQVFDDCDIAWKRLKKAVLRPDAIDLRILAVGARSVDFGRLDVVDVVTSEVHSKALDRLRSVKGQLWREGAISRAFPILKHVMLPAFSGMYLFRALRRVRLRPRSE